MKENHVYTAPSSIQGTGVFASKNFSRGDVVMEGDDYQTLNDALLLFDGLDDP